jgi:hypothetical protein
MAGMTKGDAHPADRQTMMSQKGKRSKLLGFMLQRTVSTVKHPMETTSLELSEDLFIVGEEGATDADPGISPEKAWQETKWHRGTHAELTQGQG